jgi:hypothetical protein
VPDREDVTPLLDELNNSLENQRKVIIGLKGKWIFHADRGWQLDGIERPV